MIKKLFFLTIILSLLTASFGSNFALSTGEVVAEGAILIDSDTGQILYNKNMHTPLKPASTTKVLTALLILEKFSLDEKVVITAMDALSGWTSDGGTIFKTTVNWDLGQSNFVMSGTTAMDLARWPNNTDGDRMTINSIRNDGGSQDEVSIDAFLTDTDIPDL